MNARGSEERSRQLHAPASRRAGLRRDLGRRLRLCAGGGASPLNRAQMPRSRSTRSVSAHQAWLPGPRCLRVGTKEGRPRFPRVQAGVSTVPPGKVAWRPQDAGHTTQAATFDARCHPITNPAASMPLALQVMLPPRHTRHAGKCTFSKGSSRRPATHSKALPGAIFF